jgi:microcystin-dependent protein
MANPIAVPGTVVPSGSLTTPGGAQGVQGPTAVSADAGNIATLGSDSLIFVPNAVPTGTVVDFAGSTAPANWHLCDGSSQSTTGTFAALFAVISYTFGGSGANFNMPDLRSRVSVGAGQGASLSNRLLAAIGGEENHALSIAELASHTHSITDTGHNHFLGTAQGTSAGGGVQIGGNQAAGALTSANATGITGTNAAGSGTGHNTMPPFLVLNKIIKL